MNQHKINNNSIKLSIKRVKQNSYLVMAEYSSKQRENKQQGHHEQQVIVNSSYPNDRTPQNYAHQAQFYANYQMPAASFKNDNSHASQQFESINSEYLHLKNKVQDRIKQLQGKCMQDVGKTKVSYNNTSFIPSQTNLQAGQDRYRISSIVNATNPSHIKQLINNPINQPNLPVGKTVPEQKIKTSPPYQQHQHGFIHNSSHQMRNHSPSIEFHRDCVYYDSFDDLNRYRIVSHMHQQPQPVYAPTYIPTNYMNPKIIKQTSQHQCYIPSQTAPTDNLMNSNLNQAIIQNLKTQKQINNNLKALSEKLSDLSIRRSDSSVFLDENGNQSNFQNKQIHRFQNQYPIQNGYESYGVDNFRNNRFNHSQHSNHYGHFHHVDTKKRRNDRSTHHYAQSEEDIKNPPFRKSHHRHLTENVQNYLEDNNYKKYSENYVKNDGQLGYIYHAPKHSEKTKQQQRSNKNKSSNHRIYPHYHRNEHSKNCSKHSSEKAKSVSLNSMSKEQSRGKKLYTFRQVKSPDSSNSKSKGKHKKVLKQKKFDPDYFEQHLSKNPNKKSKRKYDYHGEAVQQIPTAGHQAYHSRHADKNYPNLCADEVLDMYEYRQRRNREVYRDADHRNHKHEKDHLIKSYNQQEKLRKQLMSKINKNFFTAYGVK